MDFLHKQQRVQAIREIVKVRWFCIVIVFGLGLVLKIDYFSGPAKGVAVLPIAGMAAAAFGYNFAFWFFSRRRIEDISDRALIFVSLGQVVLDQIVYAFILYYTSTVEKIAFLLFYLTILIASSLYKTRGIVLAGCLAVVLHTTVLLAEYNNIIPHIIAYQGTVWFGNPYMTRGRIVAFAFYMGVAVLFSAALSNFNRKREEELSLQRDKLISQGEILQKETVELTKTKDYLHEALTKSDKARTDLEKAQVEINKTNLELKAKIGELEKFNQMTIGREIKMKELKEKIKTIEGQTEKKLEE